MNIKITGEFDYKLISEDSGWQIEALTERYGETEYIKLVMHSETEEYPPETELRWKVASNDIAGIWHSECSTARVICRDWFAPECISSANTSNPLWCMFAQNQENRCTVALSDAEHIIKFYNRIDENDFTIDSGIKLFAVKQEKLRDYSVIIRIDRRTIPYWQSIKEVSVWWENFYLPAKSPESCFMPHYSTWYSFHQSVTAERVEEQCEAAKKLGCAGVILDDGWQTAGDDVGYIDAGDWQICKEKFPDMAEHIKKVHSLGMKYLLWLPLPYIGEKSKAYKIFYHKTLPYKRNRGGTSLLDPRYKEVRDYLTDFCVKAVNEWDIDGFKLDFIDQFRQPDEELPDGDGGRDFESVPLATEQLLEDITSAVRKIKSESCFEFRQMYMGPAMRKYADIFRAGDCPDDILANRMRTTDLRLVSGNTAVHSDMISWNKDEKPEIAARQLLNVIFSAIQVSVRINEITDQQRKMLEFWIAFSKSYRDVLLKGEFKPLYPQLLYPTITASNDACEITAAYAEIVLKYTGKKMTYFINASDSEKLFIDFEKPFNGNAVIYDCMGNVVNTAVLSCSGVDVLNVPISGLAVLSECK